MSNKVALIFSGYNSRAVLTYIRTLEEDNIEYSIVAASLEDEIFKTIYKNNVTVTRSKKELEIKYITECLDSVLNRYQKKHFVIAPTTEALNRFFLKHRDYFQSRFNGRLEIPLVDENLYKLISDKESFSDLCVENGIHVPQKNCTDIPFVAKPKQYSEFIPQLILSIDDKKNFEKTYKTNLQEFYFQEYINGDSYYLLYYFSLDGSVTKLSQQNIIQQPNGLHIVAAKVCEVHNLEISKKFEELFLKLGFVGLIMIEVIKKDNEFYMIEANPRFWGPSDLLMKSGINLFKFYNYDNRLINKKPKVNTLKKTAKYFWKQGYLDYPENDLKYYDKNLFENNKSDYFLADLYNNDDMLQ